MVVGAPTNDTACSFYLLTGRTTSELILFWQRSPVFSHLTPAFFTVDNVSYTCIEQYPMEKKIRLFKDGPACEQITHSVDPQEHKRLGKNIQQPHQTVWEQHRKLIALDGNYAKFARKYYLRDSLVLAAGGCVFTERTPFHLLWDISLRANDSIATTQLLWGLNLFGKRLHKVRHLLFAET